MCFYGKNFLYNQSIVIYIRKLALILMFRTGYHTIYILSIYTYINILKIYIYIYLASQVVLVVKNPLANAGDVRNREAVSIPGSGISPGGRHGNPHQNSCMENPMDRGAWWAVVHGIAKSRTWLKQWNLGILNILNWSNWRRSRSRKITLNASASFGPFFPKRR